MKNLKQIARAATLTGIIILTSAVANAGIIFERTSANQNSNLCKDSNEVTSTVDGILSAVGIIDEGTVCGIIFE